MIKTLIISTLAITWLCSCGQGNNSRADKTNIESEVVDSRKNSNIQLSASHNSIKHIYTDTTYTLSNGKTITIQNSLPKGGSIEPGIPYTDSTGKEYFFVVFWTRVTNETDTALEFKVNFPADTFSLPSTFDSYIKLFHPTDKMTYDKLSSYNYGLTDIKYFLDKNFNKTTTSERTINPNEEHIFYTVAIAYHAAGPASAEVILKEHELYYKIKMGLHDPLEISVGSVTFKNE
ncbi:hypothetical protein ACU8V7_15920 [Zobellia nedashkovskayae]